MVTPKSSATRASAIPAPTELAAIRLCPQAWPSPGSASYSAMRPIVTGPLPASARNAVSKPKYRGSTLNPAVASTSPTHAAARCSSQAVSGFACKVSERAMSASDDSATVPARLALRTDDASLIAGNSVRGGDARVEPPVHVVVALRYPFGEERFQFADRIAVGPVNSQISDSPTSISNH